MTSRMTLQASLDDVLLAFNLVRGNLWPVDRLLDEKELYGVLNDCSFNGETYALPYLLFVDERLQPGSVVDFEYAGTVAFSVLVDHCYTINKREVAKLIFETSTSNHPGVKKLLESPEYAVAGRVIHFAEGCIDVPMCDAASVGEVVFQSRNPPHRAHELIVEAYAPNMTYSTPFSTAKGSDYPFAKKIQTYQEIARRYGIDVYVTTLPRVFAGPREALQNCLLFQNKGAKKLVMGRGKNCVGDFYSETASFELCQAFFKSGKIAIEPVWQETLYVGNVEPKGSVIKSEYIDRGLMPPEQLMSGYISEILLNG